jgi:hypothetical protein
MKDGNGKQQRTAKKSYTAMAEDNVRQKNLHGNERRQRRTKIHSTATVLRIAVPYPLSCVRQGRMATPPLPCVLPFVVRYMAFSFIFLSILFHLILIFIFLISFTFCLIFISVT